MKPILLVLFLTFTTLAHAEQMIHIIDKADNLQKHIDVGCTIISKSTNQYSGYNDVFLLTCGDSLNKNLKVLSPFVICWGKCADDITFAKTKDVIGKDTIGNLIVYDYDFYRTYEKYIQ